MKPPRQPPLSLEEAIGDPKIAAGFEKLRRIWPELGRAASHPLTEVLVQWDSRRKPAATIAGWSLIVLIGVACLHFTPLMMLPLPVVFAIAMFLIQKGRSGQMAYRNFFSPNPELALLPINLREYIAIRLGVEFFRILRRRKIVMVLIFVMGAATAGILAAANWFKLPISPEAELRRCFLGSWFLMHFFILPRHEQVLAERMGQLFGRLVKEDAPMMITSRLMINSVFLVFIFFYNTSIGVALFFAASLIYHLVAQRTFKTVSLDQYFDSLADYSWEFTILPGKAVAWPMKRERAVIVCHKKLLRSVDKL